MALSCIGLSEESIDQRPVDEVDKVDQGARVLVVKIICHQRLAPSCLEAAGVFFQSIALRGCSSSYNTIVIVAKVCEFISHNNEPCGITVFKSIRTVAST